jgi:crotonobetainyl-CoA:carnitine CoA-transferase CaiB-like acyl-CoA transferase
LDGIRVVDLSNTLPGAQTTQFLADYGAEVVHVEPPGGSPLRREPAWPAWARGKQSVVLDLHDRAHRDLAVGLASQADVVVETFRPGVAERFGLGYDDLASGNERLVYASITGWGRLGPYAHVKGYEALVMAKMGAFHSFRQMVPRPGPAFASVPYCSYSAAQTALHGILAALYERERSGLGQRVEASLVQGVAALDTWGWFLYLVGLRFPDAFEPQESVSDDGIPNSSFVYRLLVALTADNRWLQFSQVQPHLFDAFMRALGLDAMSEDPEWAGLPEFDAPERRSAFWERMLRAAGSKTYAEWQKVFDDDRNVWAEMFRHGSELLHHPQLVHNREVVEIDDRERGHVVQPAPLVHIDGIDLPLAGAPLLDEHGDQLRAASTRADANQPSTNGDTVEAPDAAAMPTDFPLAGVTVLELGALFAAPYGATLLTDLGARVWKVEPIAGDPIRTMVPFPEAGGAKVMQGKESIAVDLGTNEGREIVHELARRADVVLQSFRGGVAERLGVDERTLHAINPSLVYVYAPAYGHDGPCADRPAYALTIGAGAGAAWRNVGSSLRAQPDATLDEIKATSVRLAAANAVMQIQCDGLAAVSVATGLLLGLVARARGLASPSLMTTMMHSAGHALSEEMIEYDAQPPPRTADSELYGYSARYRLYEAADGWIFLAAPAEHEWGPLVAALADHVELTDELRHDDRALAAALAAAFRTRAAAEWERDLTASDVGCVVATAGPMESQLMSDEFGRASGYLADVVHPTFDVHPRLAPLVRFSRSATTAEPGCLAGQHTDAILRELGYTAARLTDLRARKVVGGQSPAQVSNNWSRS